MTETTDIQDNNALAEGLDPNDETPLYQIEDNDDDNLYSLDDDGNADDNFDSLEKDGKDHFNHKATPIALMFKIMLSPVEGWKALKREKFTPDNLFMSLLMPLTMIAAILGVASYFYDNNVTLSEVFIQAVITFFSFFFGYFIILILSGILLPASGKEAMKKPFGKNYVLVNLSTLALFYSIGELLPMLEPVLVFLPLWTLYIISRGVKILRVDKDNETSTAVWMSLLTVGVPVFCGWAFTNFLN